jgi:hypothetical protein
MATVNINISEKTTTSVSFSVTGTVTSAESSSRKWVFTYRLQGSDIVKSGSYLDGYFSGNSSGTKTISGLSPGKSYRLYFTLFAYGANYGADEPLKQANIQFTTTSTSGSGSGGDSSEEDDEETTSEITIYNYNESTGVCLSRNTISKTSSVKVTTIVTDITGYKFLYATKKNSDTKYYIGDTITDASTIYAYYK